MEEKKFYSNKIERMSWIFSIITTIFVITIKIKHPEVFINIWNTGIDIWDFGLFLLVIFWFSCSIINIFKAINEPYIKMCNNYIVIEKGRINNLKNNNHTQKYIKKVINYWDILYVWLKPIDSWKMWELWRLVGFWGHFKYSENFKDIVIKKIDGSSIIIPSVHKWEDFLSELQRRNIQVM